MTMPQGQYNQDGLPIEQPQMQQQFGQVPQYLPTQQYQMAPAVAGPPKTKVVAALLAFFLGAFGAHNFYLGSSGKAIAQLMLFLFGAFTSLFIIGFFILGALETWVLIEFVLILLGSGSYARDARGVPLQ
ncbi:TM2 domain-containing protein [Corynebacterium sp. H130]|uniref:TM2 domain-containing protein n=1 Tax=Corynebacterium sp. H130 TaxID=3133444 RepID=UPI0030A9F195